MVNANFLRRNTQERINLGRYLFVDIKTQRQLTVDEESEAVARELDAEKSARCGKYTQTLKTGYYGVIDSLRRLILAVRKRSEVR